MKKSKNENSILTRVESILRDYDGVAPAGLVRVIEEIEREGKIEREKTLVADELEALLARAPREEEIHAFIAEHPSIVGHRSRFRISNLVAEGVLTKFPVSPDRIPDFIFLSLALTRTQHPNRIDIFELKRADALLFSSHNRLSKDLNDAWMEAVDTQRIIGLNYSDFLRRAITQLLRFQNSKERSKRSAKQSKTLPYDDFSRPRCGVRIIIGRRASLSAEDMMRVRELGFSTNFSIGISTYDSLLDDLRGLDGGETSRWRW